MKTSINSTVVMVTLFSGVWILGTITASDVKSQNEQAMLKGSTVVIGTVTGIRGTQFEVEYQDSLQPRFLPLQEAREKGMEIAEGDKINMVFNEQHVLVDFHPLGHLEGEHKVIRGVIQQPMPVVQNAS